MEPTRPIEPSGIAAALPRTRNVAGVELSPLKWIHLAALSRMGLSLADLQTRSEEILLALATLCSTHRQILAQTVAAGSGALWALAANFADANNANADAFRVAASDILAEYFAATTESAKSGNAKRAAPQN